MYKIILFLFVYSFGFSQNLIPENTVRFVTVNNIPAINLNINGKNAFFLIDTGASNSLIDIDSAKEYNFICENLHKKTITSVGSSIIKIYKTENIKAYYNEIVFDIEFKAMDLTHLKNNMSVLGVIGADWLNKNNIIIDYKRKILWLR